MKKFSIITEESDHLERHGKRMFMNASYEAHSQAKHWESKGDKPMAEMLHNDASRMEHSAKLAHAGDHKEAVRNFNHAETGARDHAYNGNVKSDHAKFNKYLDKHR